MQRNGVVEIGVGQDIEDGCKSLRPYHLGLCWHTNESGRHVEPGIADAVPATHHSSAVRACGRERFLHRLERGFVDQRPDQNTGIEGTTDLELRVRGRNAVDDVVGDRLVNDEPAQ